MAQTAANTNNETARRVPLSMSHIGIYVHDVPKMEDFYTRVLGFTVTDRGKVRGMDIVFTSWDAKDHHQVILVAGRPKELAYNHINQISFRVTSVEDLQAVWRRVKDEPGVYRSQRNGSRQRMVAVFPRSRKAIASKSSATPSGTSSNPASKTSICRCRQIKFAPSLMRSAAPRPVSSRSPNIRPRSPRRSRQNRP